MEEAKIKIDIKTLKHYKAIDAIADDFALFEDIHDVPLFDFPTRLDCIIVAVCIEGYIEMGINLKQHTLNKNEFAITLPENILQLFKISDDFKGRFIVMSREFLSNSNIELSNVINAFLYLRGNPITGFTNDSLEIFIEYFNLIKHRMVIKEVNVKREIAIHLLQALFIDITRQLAINIEKVEKTRKEIVFEQFMKQVFIYYKQERSISFYAEKLCLTPKYLSSIIKQATGKLAGEWIDACVVLEAKMLLKCSEKSIQQIAEELNFANQSFFGKYFKHHTGMSPSKYKEEGSNFI